MKRYSVPVLATLTVFVFIITSVIKTPLEPQEVLAKALEQYESGGGEGEIYHQKIAVYQYENDALLKAYISESYHDTLGNSLNLMRKIESNEIESAELIRIDEFGDVEGYSNKPSKLFSPIGPKEQEWLDIFKGEKIYCIEEIEGDGEIYEKGTVTLITAIEDPSVYQLEPRTELKIDPNTTEENNLSQSLNLASTQKTIRKLIEKGNYNYTQVEYGGKKHYLFIEDNFSFYIDAQTYAISMWEIHDQQQGGGLWTEKYVILENEYLPQSEAFKIFDPTQFQGMERMVPLMGLVIPFEAQKSGCFDYKGESLEQTTFDQLPESLKKEWTLAIEGIKAEMKQASSPRIPQSFPLNWSTLPSKGYVSQGYYENHSGWDFALNEDQDNGVYSPKAGAVMEIVEGWNEGRGNMIIIAHELNGKKFQTIYEHLDQVHVKLGQNVSEGQQIGMMGKSGRTVGKTGITLHFGVLVNGEPVDPNLLWGE